MNNKQHIIYLLALSCLLSCGPSSQQRSAGIDQDSMTYDPLLRAEKAGPDNGDEKLQASMRQSKSVLEKQLREGAYWANEVTDISKDPFDLNELKATIFEVKNILFNQHRLEWENQHFAQKVKEIFGIDIPADSSALYRYVNLFEPCNDRAFYHRNNGIDYHGFFIVKPENFITDFYYLPEIIDYQHLHSDLAEAEKHFPVKSWSKTYKTEVEIGKWRDMEIRTEDEYNLGKQRAMNRQRIIYRNRFLFNNDNSCLEWLLQHDSFFMESLIKKFGWTRNHELVHWAVTKTRFNASHPEDFGSLFWRKKCDGSLTIHTNTYTVLSKLYTADMAPKMTAMLSDMQHYLEYMLDPSPAPHHVLTDKQLLEILAHMVYFAEQYKYKGDAQSRSTQRMMGRFRHMLSAQHSKILKNNHYFHLPMFKKWWDAADYDAYYVDGEYNGPWGRDNEPMTEAEWREQKP